MERLHKMVNGQRVDCTQEEEEQIKLEWEANRLKAEQRKQEQLLNEQKKEELRKKLAESLNVTIDDLKLLIK